MKINTKSRKQIIVWAATLFMGIAGLFITTSAFGQGGGENERRTNDPNASPQPTWEDLFRGDPIRLMKACMRFYDTHYRDYTCTFTKQERLSGGLREPQTMAVKFRQDPYSVAMQWLTNPPGADRMLYVAGENKDRVKVRPTGLPGLLVRSVNLAPDDPRIMESSLYPVTQFGFRRNLEYFLDIERRARAEGFVDPRDPDTRGVETRSPDTGRPAFRFIRRLSTNRGYPADLIRIYIDAQYRVPTRMEGFDADGQLIFRYIFTNVRFNVGLTDDDFSPRANGMK